MEDQTIERYTQFSGLTVSRLFFLMGLPGYLGDSALFDPTGISLKWPLAAGMELDDRGVDRLKQGGYALAAERGERLPLARQVASTVEELLGKIRVLVEEARLEPVGGSNVARRCLP